MRVTVRRSFAFPYTQDVRPEIVVRVCFKVTPTEKRLPMYIVETPLIFCRLRLLLASTAASSATSAFRLAVSFQEEIMTTAVLSVWSSTYMFTVYNISSCIDEPVFMFTA